ncbi:hypothetical protein A1O1_07093 [Capronia coronata CBS 617.96]|uniref:GPI-anchored wall transfer protein n=1 Tax=Capronia coronata CBS 617.96 TaxID=1182541 RepID=W9Y1H3_9EURO|nr:uncharacterized protein A1O1_07093 [Capronia coronata CBS 617.96]EXJ83470.1 hypothetical protein A1O1_07093 [Capronia coronata CBS 617.96]
MTPDLAASYKARKEAFVSNLSGSSLTEINLVTLVAGSAVLLWIALQKKQSFFTPYTPIAAVADFLLNVCAILFAITIYSSAPLLLSVFLVTPATILLCLNGAERLSKRSTTSSAASRSNNLDMPNLLPVRPFLTHYRGSMLVVTCLAILAVDFPVFPRRFAKVETWGTSLMDLGVGSFVFSAGVVSARAVVKGEEQKKKKSSQTDNDNNNSTSSSFPSTFINTIRHSLPLFLLGFIRLWSVKGLDYAEHVTEYGVHWNFFFTLALLPPFVELADALTRLVFHGYRYDTLAVVLALAYELVLNNTDLLRYIVAAPRGPDLLSMNREGVFSFAGYLAIFLAGRGTGMRVVRFPSTSTSSTSSPTTTDQTSLERRLILRDLLIQSAIYTTLYVLSTDYHVFNLRVSRRLANLPYVLWVAAFNNAQIFLFGLIESYGPAFSYFSEDTTTATTSVRNATSPILRAFNSNGLVVFLLANLLTGLVNMTVNTLDMAALHAVAVLLVYAALVTGVAVVLDMAGIKIRI